MSSVTKQWFSETAKLSSNSEEAEPYYHDPHFGSRWIRVIADSPCLGSAAELWRRKLREKWGAAPIQTRSLQRRCSRHRPESNVNLPEKHNAFTIPTACGFTQRWRKLYNHTTSNKVEVVSAEELSKNLKKVDHIHYTWSTGLNSQPKCVLFTWMNKS